MAWGWGMCQESWVCPQQRTGKQPATRVGPRGLPYPTQVVSFTLPPLQHPQQVGSHLAAGGSLPPSMGLPHAAWCPDLGVEASPTYTSTCRSWFCPGYKCNSHPAHRLPQRTKSTVGSLSTPALFSPKLHGLEITNSKPHYLGLNPRSAT